MDSDRKTPLPDDTSDTSQGRYNSGGPDSSKEENPDKTVSRPESPPSDNRQFSFFKPRDLIGKIVSNGKYQIEELIGEGGMGAVFKASDRGFGRKVAIKVLLPHLASNPLTMKRLGKEITATSHIEHEHSVRFYEWFTDDNGLLYFVMELLDGKTLDELIKKDGSLSLEKAVKIVTDACSALEYAHKKYKILHRDLKPSNIMLVTVGGDQEYVKIIDWGIAKILEAEGGATTGPHTQTGAPIGSPAYMSPEQIRGEDLGPSSDVYSLGCVFYECITGEKAFKGDNPFALMQLHLSDERPLLPPWYAATPIERERLQRLLDRCLAVDPNERFENIEQLSTALNSCIRPEEVKKSFSFLSSFTPFSTKATRNKKQTVPFVSSGLMGILLGTLLVSGVLAVCIWQSGIFFSIPDSERQIPIILPKQFNTLSNQERDEQDQIYQLKTSYAKRISNQDFIDASVKAGDYFFNHGDLNYAMKYYGPAMVALKAIGGENSAEGALLCLRTASCSIPLKLNTGQHVGQLIEAEKIYRDRLPDDLWNIQLFEISDLESQGRYEMSKENYRGGPEVWLGHADWSYALSISQYEKMNPQWQKQYSETMIPILIRAADYFFARAKESKDSTQVRKFCGRAIRGYIHVSEECEGNSNYDLVAASALNSAGQVMLLSGQSEYNKQAIDAFSKALKILDNHQGNYDRDKSKILVNLANAFFKIGDFGQAMISKCRAQYLWH